MNSFVFLSLVFALIFLNSITHAGTAITVSSNYKKELNIKIQGTGVGGCDIVMNNGQVDSSDCWCLWGTLNYSFCAYYKKPITEEENNFSHSNSTAEVGDGRCPVITGATLLCKDVTSLGNCYGKGYTCKVASDGTCLCGSA